MKLEEEIVQSKFRNEHHKLVLNILFTNNWLLNSSEKHFKEKGITMQQYNILRILRGQFPKPASVNLLKERMLDKMPDASRLVERLRIKGLITRSECKQDRRVSDVLITEKGLKLLKQFDQLDADNDRLLSTLSDKEAATVNDLLDKLRG